MKISIERASLLKAVGQAQSVVERRNTIPILSNVLLKATGASLEMKATDLDLEMTEATAAQVERTGDYLSRMDSDGDGRVSRDEYLAWMGYAFEKMEYPAGLTNAVALLKVTLGALVLLLGTPLLPWLAVPAGLASALASAWLGWNLLQVVRRYRRLVATIPR